VSDALPRAALGVADEAAVVACAMAGDEAAFSELIRRRQAQVRQLLRRLCRDATLADDLAQQAFLQAWRRLRSLRAPGAFGGWLRKLTINIWLQHARGRYARDAASEDGLEREVAIYPPIGERLDLDRALGRLAPAVRLCIVLGYGEHMSHREISEATGLPLGTVKSHIARGAERLRKMLEAYA